MAAEDFDHKYDCVVIGLSGNAGGALPSTPDTPLMTRHIPPTYSEDTGMWNHQPGKCCTCGCEKGGWSTSEHAMVKKRKKFHSLFFTCQIFDNETRPIAGFFFVRQAWRVARKRTQLGYGGHADDLEVKVLRTLHGEVLARGKSVDCES